MSNSNTMRSRSSEDAMEAVKLESLPQSFRSNRSDLKGDVEFKAVPITEWKVDQSKRLVEGWAARYGNVDLGGDRILPGAASKTISDRLPRKLIKFFWNHEFGIGVPETLEEHDAGLLAVGKVNDHADFDKYLSMIEQGVASHMSIGYTVVKATFIQEEEDQSVFDLIREISEFKLFEWSPVYWPMNELAEITAVKAAHAIAGRDSAAESFRNLQKAYSMMRVGSLSSKYERDLRSILTEVSGLSEVMQKALDDHKREPGPSGETTLNVEPRPATALLSALQSLNEKVQNI